MSRPNTVQLHGRRRACAQASAQPQCAYPVVMPPDEGGWMRMNMRRRRGGRRVTTPCTAAEDSSSLANYAGPRYLTVSTRDPRPLPLSSSPVFVADMACDRARWLHHYPQRQGERDSTSWTYSSFPRKTPIHTSCCRETQECKATRVFPCYRIHRVCQGKVCHCGYFLQG